jgi:ribonuclease D
MTNKFQEKISKDEINLLPLAEFKGKMIVITNAEDAVAASLELSKEKIIGFDTETRPAYKKGESYPVAMIQLAGEFDVYIFRINQFMMPSELTNLLANPDIVKSGVAIRDDIKGLKKIRNFTPGGFVELADMAKDNKINSFGLRGLAAITLGVRISKGAKLTNWERSDLNKAQLTYAATDAWIGREIYLKLC